MTIMNLSLLRKNLYTTIVSVVEHREPVIIVSKKGNAVIISEWSISGITLFIVF